ncbi:MAG: PQQ-dependent sugar dehydrogenase, partial [Hymenobacter sp.]|nr:PQQ-dependent sugar dehydrogenase [Hymenobacter sp.]
MHFGLDGKLYVAVGENANGANAQNLDTYHGKLLRINADGSVPAGNPYVGTGLSAQRQRVWSHGLRNPFTFAVQPGTGRIFVNDVGGSSWEEINDATTSGLNYGWPNNEGANVRPGQTPPFYAYTHGANNPEGYVCAITGGTFFNPASTNYPAAYVGKYFYQDLCGRWINHIDPNDGSAPARTRFATNLSGDLVGLDTGPDGNLYYLSRGAAALYKIVYTAGTTAPVITTQPLSATVSAGVPVTFSVAVNGTAPFGYQWQKNGANIAGATASSYTIASVAAADAGQYRVVVTNSVGSATSNAATLTVTAFNNPPTAQILTPTSGTTYVAGTEVQFSADATDPEDGALPASAFVWQVNFHHNTHVHDGVPFNQGSKTGIFAIPNSGEVADDVFYRLVLTVTDAGGRKTTIFRDVQPQKTTFSLATSPAGLGLTLDGAPQATPAAIVGVEGVLRSLGAPSPQTVNGVTYEFVSWSNGGTQTQTVATPTDDATYTATYRVVPSNGTLRAPENPATTAAGLDYAYYQGLWNSLPDFSTLTPTSTGTVTTFDLTPRLQDDAFAFRYTGYVTVPADGQYTFYTTSDDGSRLYIGSTLVVDNDGLHGAQEREGTIGLQAGTHAFTVTFFERAGGQVLNVRYAGPGITKTLIPASALKRATSTTPPASTLRVPENPTSTAPGLDYAYYQGLWTDLPAFASLTPESTGTVPTFDLTPRLR